MEESKVMKSNGIIKQPDVIIKRIKDGKLFEPSFVDNPCSYQDLISMFVPKGPWVCREIEYIGKKWWQKKPRWKRTGYIWLTNNRSEFDII
jgi:hypothetical protein